MTIYGYARVSSDGQSLDVQLAQLKSAGCTTKTIFAEKESGSGTGRPVPPPPAGILVTPTGVAGTCISSARQLGVCDHFEGESQPCDFATLSPRLQQKNCTV